MDMVESLSNASLSRRNQGYSLHSSAGQVVLPAGNDRTDISALLLQFQLPDIDFDNVNGRLMQYELGSVQSRFR